MKDPAQISVSLLDRLERDVGYPFLCGTSFLKPVRFAFNSP